MLNHLILPLISMRCRVRVTASPGLPAGAEWPHVASRQVPSLGGKVDK
jgi:hypothetical protein